MQMRIPAQQIMANLKQTQKDWMPTLYLELLHSVWQATHVDEEDVGLLLQYSYILSLLRVLRRSSLYSFHSCTTTAIGSKCRMPTVSRSNRSAESLLIMYCSNLQDASLASPGPWHQHSPWEVLC